jgi:hypothetical protein
LQPPLGKDRQWQQQANGFLLPAAQVKDESAGLGGFLALAKQVLTQLTVVTILACISAVRPSASLF